MNTCRFASEHAKAVFCCQGEGPFMVGIMTPRQLETVLKLKPSIVYIDDTYNTTKWKVGMCAGMRLINSMCWDDAIPLVQLTPVLWGGRSIDCLPSWHSSPSMCHIHLHSASAKTTKRQHCACGWRSYSRRSQQSPASPWSPLSCLMEHRPLTMLSGKHLHLDTGGVVLSECCHN